ncbi:MAG: hypothetical protein U5R49_24635 [Deltaproteobacteria bacterium]|nr:hypothetical protein [Deltaproteobacteria bacterium]
MGSGNSNYSKGWKNFKTADEEMTIGGQGFFNMQFFHEDKTRAVGQRKGLISPPEKLLKGSLRKQPFHHGSVP